MCHVIAKKNSTCVLVLIKNVFLVFKDTNTPSPFIENLNDPEAKAASKPDHIYMDCMGFGMGNSCLQLTFQACNIDEAKLLYDQLAPVCPIMVSVKRYMLPVELCPGVFKH